MIIEVIVFLGVVTMAMFAWNRRYDWWGDGFEAIFASLLIGGVVYGIVSVGLVSIQDPYESVKTQNLQALSIDGGPEGSWLRVRTDLSYSYFAKNTDGSYSAHIIDADRVRIIEDDDETPRVERIYHLREGSPWVAWNMIDLDRIDVYVPEGSVIQDYTLSLD